MSAQGGYDDLSAPHLSDPESDDNVEQVLLDMVDEGELELVWLEDRQEFGFYMPEPTDEEQILPSQGAHAAPRPRRTVGLRRCAVLTVAAFVSPFIVGTAYASVVSGKPTLPSIVPDVEPHQQAASTPPPVAAAPATTPLVAKTVPVKTVPKAKKAAPKTTKPVTHTAAPAQDKLPTYEHYRQFEEHRHHRHRNWNWDGKDAARELIRAVGRHRGLPDPHEAVQEVTQRVIQAPISPRDLLHHVLRRQSARTDMQVIQVALSESGNTTNSGNHQGDTASDALDRTGNKGTVSRMSSATPLGTKVVSAA